ncbi:MAG: MFS transporter [Nocardioides sp.]|uniref:MFS transporter n=1 Tax=Nocardioides sp. TaxID=35761 RepID=UPI0039E2FE85
MRKANGKAAAVVDSGTSAAAEAAGGQVASLWRSRQFMGLWAGQSVSQIGSAVTVFVLPLVAIQKLGAGPGDVGLMRGLAATAAILVAIPGGVLVDRRRKRRVMIACDLLTATALVSLPVAALLDVLRLAQLYVVAFVTGAVALVFGVAYHAYIPRLVPVAALKEANSKTAATEAVARVSGPPLGASLVSLFGAATTVLLDVVSCLVSAATIWRLTPAEGDRAGGERTKVDDAQGVWAQAKGGVRLVFANRTLTQTAVTTIGSMWAFAMFDAVLLYFMLTDLGVSTAVVGVVFAVGEAGGLLAALFVGKLMTWVGSARIMWLAVFLSAFAFLPVFAHGQQGAWLVAAFGALSAARFVIFDVAQYVYRQTVCPQESFGRITATIRLGIGISTALGAFLGGLVGAAFSARAALLVAAIVMCLASLPVLVSAELRRVRDIEELASIDVG